MTPTRESGAALVDLVDVLLREGAVIRADVVITVADVPLVGVSLNAAIAGMATMTDYGMLTQLDAGIRADADPAVPDPTDAAD